MIHEIMKDAWFVLSCCGARLRYTLWQKLIRQKKQVHSPRHCRKNDKAGPPEPTYEHTRLSQSGLTMNQSQFAVLLGFWPSGVPDDVEIHAACDRACCTISTKAIRVSAGLFTSRKKAMRAPRMPSRVFIRT